jgi:transaldolase
MANLIARGVRGVTANPTIVAKAIESSDAYDQQLHDLLDSGHTQEDAYWELAIADVVDALKLLRPTYDASEGADGFVSIEVAPDLANDTEATMRAARDLHELIEKPNLLVKIPATTAGVPAIEAMIAEGRSINVTLIFSLPRYSQVLEAYLSGLEAMADRGARVQRPLWASTSTKNPRYPDTLYVDSLIGPDTVNTLPESTLKAFEDHGTLARTIDVDVLAAEHVMDALANSGIDMDDVGHTLEKAGIAAFQTSFAHVLGILTSKSTSRPHAALPAPSRG